MSNHKSYSVQVEVPTKKPSLKELLINTEMHSLIEACIHIAERLSSNNDNRQKLWLTIAVPQVQLDSHDQGNPSANREGKENICRQHV